MYNKNKIVCIIPARGGSKGIPNKNTVLIAGKPLILWTTEQATGSKYIDEVYVSSDCDNIISLCNDNNINTIKRPAEISGDSDSSESALIHSLKYIYDKFKVSFNLIVFLQCTSPLRKRNDIDQAIDKFFSNDYDSLMSITELDDLTLWSNDSGELKSINFDYKNRGMRQNRPLNYIENGSIYLIKPNTLKTYNNRLGVKIGTYKMEFWQTFELDSHKEIDLIEFYMRKHVIQNHTSTLFKNDIELIAFDFDGVLTDNKVLIDQDGKESAIVNRSDGLAISMLVKMGYPIIVISTEKNKIVRHRCKKLGIPCYNGVENKLYQLKLICDETGYNLKNVIFVGNDINDKEVMLNVGYPICPSDADNKIKLISKLILNSSGGNGVARELLNYLEKRNGNK